MNELRGSLIRCSFFVHPVAYPLTTLIKNCPISWGLGREISIIVFVDN